MEREGFMQIAVVYESMYGNTAAIAAAVAEGMSEEGDVTPVPAGCTLPGDIDLLVVGAPTHAHGLSTRSSRRTAEQIASEWRAPGVPENGHRGRGVRSMLAETTDVDATPAAVFDTRYEGSTLLTGSAARVIARKLRALGYRLVVEPESFFVEGSEGPLKSGELERAMVWGRSLLSTFVPAEHR